MVRSPDLPVMFNPRPNPGGAVTFTAESDTHKNSEATVDPTETCSVVATNTMLLCETTIDDPEPDTDTCRDHDPKTEGGLSRAAISAGENEAMP